MKMWQIVLVGIVSVAWGLPGAHYGDQYGAHFPYGDTGPDPKKAYDFSFQTPSQGRREASDVNGDVRGRYNYLDDMGIQRTVDYIAGKNTGFVVTNETPDPSPANEANYYRPSKPGASHGTYEGTRGYLSSKLNLDGSYNFKHSSPHQSHSEVKDAFGRVQGEYSYYDKEGKLHYVQYEAGPGIGYRVLNTNDGQPTPPVKKPTPGNSYGPNSYGQVRAGRSPEKKDETLETAHSENYGSSLKSQAMKDSSVKVHYHGNGPEKGSDAQLQSSDRAVQIAWSPASFKKPTGVAKTFKHSAEEYERAPDLDAVDYYMDDVQKGSHAREEQNFNFELEQENRSKEPFLINVPDPIFAARADSQMTNLPLSPQEQDAINNLKDYSREGATKRVEKPAPENFKERPEWATRDDSEENSAASSYASRRWHSGFGNRAESLVSSHDLLQLRGRLSPTTPRLAQVISLD